MPAELGGSSRAGGRLDCRDIYSCMSGPLLSAPSRLERRPPMSASLAPAQHTRLIPPPHKSAYVILMGRDWQGKMMSQAFSVSRPCIIHSFLWPPEDCVVAAQGQALHAITYGIRTHLLESGLFLPFFPFHIIDYDFESSYCFLLFLLFLLFFLSNHRLKYYF